MKATFCKSFSRDLKKIQDQTVLKRIRQAVEQVEAAGNLHEIGSVKKMGGTGDYYRIRIGDYRIGIAFEQGRVEFVRCLHRRDLYRFFP